MSSRTRLIAVAALLACAIVAAAVYALSGHRGPTTAAAKPTTTAGGPGAVSGAASAGVWVPDNAKLADVCRSKLPDQARDTLTLIARRGPYPYRTDGVVFENRESRLPGQRSGYYHEYTVVTPGSDDRGTRRVVTGSAGEQYWTGDHYASFQEIDARC